MFRQAPQWYIISFCYYSGSLLWSFFNSVVTMQSAYPGQKTTASLSQNFLWFILHWWAVKFLIAKSLHMFTTVLVGSLFWCYYFFLDIRLSHNVYIPKSSLCQLPGHNSTNFPEVHCFCKAHIIIRLLRFSFFSPSYHLNFSFQYWRAMFLTN